MPVEIETRVGRSGIIIPEIRYNDGYTEVERLPRLAVLFFERLRSLNGRKQLSELAGAGYPPTNVVVDDIVLEHPTVVIRSMTTPTTGEYQNRESVWDAGRPDYNRRGVITLIDRYQLLIPDGAETKQWKTLVDATYYEGKAMIPPWYNDQYGLDFKGREEVIKAADEFYNTHVDFPAYRKKLAEDSLNRLAGIFNRYLGQS